ncbi:unnamed protein product [Allacma fusca]|uniref:Uncharacterized protein n=1 Tax=Allacma fusca TaxID=39272 RepID=A0A8J2LLZ0_9HEXA|nr:unnamed protein product [Allacma fusca]
MSRRAKARSLRRQKREFLNNFTKALNLTGDDNDPVPTSKTTFRVLTDGFDNKSSRDEDSNRETFPSCGATNSDNEPGHSEKASKEPGDMITLLYYKGLQCVAEYMFSYLDAESLSAMEKVSKECKQMVMEGLLWKKMLEKACSKDSLMWLICIKDGWSSFLFKPKSSSVCYELYKDLYIRVKHNRQQLIRNWRGEHGVRVRFKVRNVASNSTSPCSHQVSCMYSSPEALVLGFSNGLIKIFETSTLKHMKTWRQREGVACLKADSNVLIAATTDHNLHVLDVNSGTLLKTLIYHSAPVTDLHFNEKWLISCSKDKTLKVWCRITTANFVPAITLVDDLRQGFNCLDFNNQYVVAGSDDSSIKVWKMECWSKFGNLHGHEDIVTCIQINDKYVVSGSLDGKVRVWYTAFGTCIRVLSYGWSVLCLRINNDYIVTGDHGLICVWDFQAVLRPDKFSSDEHVFLQQITHQTGRIRGIFMDEFKIVSCSDDNTVMFSEFLFFDGLNE